MNIGMNKKKKYFLFGGTTLLLFVWLFFYVNLFCELSQGICVLIAFLIQAPAYLIVLPFKVQLSNQTITWLFRVITTIFWFLIGGIIGLVIYNIGKNR